MRRAAEAEGLRFAAEAFADRALQRRRDRCVSREVDGAVITDPGGGGPGGARSRATAGPSRRGRASRCAADTLCLHGDNPAAVANARAVRQALDAAGVALRPPRALSVHPRVLPVGDAAATLELGDAIDPAVNARVRGARRGARRAPVPRASASRCPRYRSLLVVLRPGRAWLRRGARRPLEAPSQRTARRSRRRAPARRCPWSTAASTGPTWPRWRAHRRPAEAEVARHARARSTRPTCSASCPASPTWACCRRSWRRRGARTPRAARPRGLRWRIAGRQTARLPLRHARRLEPASAAPRCGCSTRAADPPAADPARRPRALRRAADGWDQPRGGRADRAADRARPASRGRSTAGLLTTVQDLGRRGHRRARACPGRAPGRARAARGEPRRRQPARRRGAGVRGCRARRCASCAPVRLAVTGADLGAVLERDDLGAWPVPPGTAVLARPGNVLCFTGRRAGCRAYVRAGRRPRRPAGARLARHGPGRRLRRARRPRAARGRSPGRGRPRRGALRPRGRRSRARARREPARRRARRRRGPRPTRSPRRRVARSCRVDVHGAAPPRTASAAGWTGPRSTTAAAGEIRPDGMVPGCIQVPPDGQPIVVMADGPTTGGYPKIATVVGADLPRLAQLAPGETVGFREVHARGSGAGVGRAMTAGLLAAPALAALPSQQAAATPPDEKGPFRAPDLVEVVRAGAHAQARRPLRDAAQLRAARPSTPRPRVFLQRPAAEALVRAHRGLAPQATACSSSTATGPWSVTKLFWDVTPQDKRDFVANPREGLASTTAAAPWTSPCTTSPTAGRCEMPSAYDEITERAAPDYAGGTAGAARAPRPAARGHGGGGLHGGAQRVVALQLQGLAASIPILDVPFSQRSAAAAPLARDRRRRRTRMSKGLGWVAWPWWSSCWWWLVLALARRLQQPGRPVAGGGRAVGAGGERLPAARRPHPEPRGHRPGRGRLREVHAGGGHPGPGQRGPGAGRPGQHAPTIPPPSPLRQAPGRPRARCPGCSWSWSATPS